MKAVMISIQPKWVEKIASGEKTITLKKTRPTIKTPFKCYIYCTNKKPSDDEWQFKPNLYLDSTKKVRWIDVAFESIYKCEFLEQKVIGEFVCDDILEFESEFWDDDTYESIAEVWYDSYGDRNVDVFVSNDGAYYKDNMLCRESCVSWEDLRKYVGTGIKTFYAWHISDIKIYDKPKDLSEFRVKRKKDIGWDIPTVVLTRPPQSWCYVEEI